MRIIIVILLVISLAVQHFRFLDADPDAGISRSRGPFTDEGLYTLQVRNWINGYGLDINESGSLVKTPLYSVIMSGSMALTGTNLVAARLVILLFVIATLCYLATRKGVTWITCLFIVLGLYHYYVFHFTHYCVPEMMSICFILLGIYFLFQHYHSPPAFGKGPLKQQGALFRSALFLSFAWYAKIQFVYIAALLPVFAVVWFVLARTTRNLNNIKWSLLFSLGFGVLYLLLWYLPLMDTFNYVLFDQTSDRFPPEDIFWNIVEENYHKVFLTEYTHAFTSLFFALAVIGIVLAWISKSRAFRLIYAIALVWILLELHKVAIWWVPARYIVSLVVAAAVMMAAVGCELFRLLYQRRRSVISGSLAALLTLAILIVMAGHWRMIAHSTGGRQYQIKEINGYLAQIEFGDRPILGGWGAAFNWDCRAKSFPVWSGYLNDRDVLSCDPMLIISENQEEDSGEAYKKSGIDLTAISDSVVTFEVGRWPLNFYWISQRTP